VAGVYDVLKKEQDPVEDEEFVKRCEEILDIIEEASDKLKLLQRDRAAELVRREAQKQK
jgi:hypothetical protein